MSTKMSPFEALCGYPPPKLLGYVTHSTQNATVEAELKTRTQVLELLKHNLHAARERAK